MHRFTAELRISREARASILAFFCLVVLGLSFRAEGREFPSVGADPAFATTFPELIEFPILDNLYSPVCMRRWYWHFWHLPIRFTFQTNCQYWHVTSDRHR